LGARQFSLFDPARTSTVRIISFLFLITLFSCARKPVVQPVSAPADKNTRVSLKTLSVVKTQEILGDELVLVGALGIIENGKVRPVQVFSSYVGKVKKGQIIRLDTIKALEIRLRSGQKASFQLSLFEIEDYQPAKKWVNRFNSVSGVLALPLALTSAENPVAWFLWGTKVGSLGLDWLSELDVKDLLGVSETQWDAESGLSTTRNGKWVGGRKMIDAYEYRYQIQINVD
jgi:hypothetical protein